MNSRAIRAPSAHRRLIVNADDFGNSDSINAAVIDAHRNGILTAASLMVNGPACAQAVQLARENPRLGVGLHLTLCCGTAALPPREIPHLADASGHFTNSPVSAGMRYFFSSAARRELEREIDAQFEKFARTGLVLDHVNGHLHFHLHPAVFPILERQFEKRQVRAARLTRAPWATDWPLGRGRWFYRASHALIFSLLSHRAKPAFNRLKISRTDFVFGLLEDSRVGEKYILDLLPRLPSGDSELYSHPSLDEFKHEHQALVSPRVQHAVKRENIQLIRYQDLWRDC